MIKFHATLLGGRKIITGTHPLILKLSRLTVTVFHYSFFFDSACFATPKKMANHSEHDINRVKRLLSSDEPSKSDQLPRFINTHVAFELLPRQLRDGSTKAKVSYK